MIVRQVRRGKVWLVGAGPGDPELLTVRAARLLSSCSVLAYDELVSDRILALAPPEAERIPVGRRANGCRHHDEKIHPAVIDRALAGFDVVRLKGGDPFVFGRGGEEAEELAAAGISFEVIPGITAALGAASSAHVPLTHRDVAQSVTFATAHFKDDATTLDVPSNGTLVLYMGLGRMRETCAALVRGGRPLTTPAAVISHATLPTERRVTGTLADLADLVTAAKLPAPALMIIGEVVARAVASPVPRFMSAAARRAAL